MKENSKETKRVALSETIELGAEGENNIPVSKAKRLKSYIRDICYKARIGFSKKCETSFISNTLERLYYVILSCPLKVFGTFLFVFGLCSIALTFAVEASFTKILTDSGSQVSFVILLIGLIFFTSNKQIGELLSSSKIFSHFGIAYNQPVFSKEMSKKKGLLESYSTSFFTGILAGILSVIYPSHLIVFFAISLAYLLFILNRPECGLPLVLFLTPFISGKTAAFITVVCFISFIFKYLRGKRHIDFKSLEALLVITGAYVLLKAFVTKFDISQLKGLLYLFAFLFAVILTVSLIRSTAMFRRSVSLLLSLSHIFTLLLCAFYLMNIFLGSYMTSVYISTLGLSGLQDTLYSKEFITAFLALTIPINFSLIIGKNSKDKVKNSIYFVLLLSCSMYVLSFSLILTLISGCVLVLMLHNIKFIFLLIPCPALAYGATLLYDFIPERYIVTSSSTTYGDIQNAAENIKQNFFLGNGFINAPFDNTLINLLFILGIFGTLLVFACIFVLFFKSFKSVFSIGLKDKSRTYAQGLLSGAICFSVVSIFTNCLTDFRIIFLFGVVLTLSFTSGRCFEADFVDPTSPREQIHHE